MNRLKEKYQNVLKKEIQQKLEFKNIMQVPKLIKVSVNMGVGEAVVNRSAVENARKQLELLTGQHSLITKARRSISNFKIREGDPIGTKTTLRSEIMYNFVDKLFSIVIPRLRDFEGISPKGFDGYGNFTLGFKDQTVFPEIEYDKVDKVRGLNITFVTTANNDEEGYVLLKSLGMPFKKK
ncbi:MAG: 50S ribosomal protein L5 [Candidatus Cloacimonadota bacterium]|nr:50S ribosomal protein L5 [Candidatus Cloacimonadota bacterium]